MTALHTELTTDPEGIGYAAAWASGDNRALVELLNAPRYEVTEYAETEIGVGTIIEVMGLADGNAFLDALFNTPDYRHIKPLLEQGRLRLDSPFVRATLAGLINVLVTQAQYDAFLALCTRTRMQSRAEQVIGRRARIDDVREARNG